MDLSYKLNSLYVCVKDMDRAVAFYEKLFEQKVTERNDTYSVFDIHGFRYGLFANDKVMEVKKWGNNCLPGLSVNDMDLFLKKLRELKCKLIFPLTVIGKNKVLEFADSEGNAIEISCPVKE